MKRIENIKILGLDDNEIPTRIYIPNRTKDQSMLVFFHGGGWMYGGVEPADALCRRLAHYLQCVVASVEYRLAPEHPFPMPLEDCYAATQWLAENASQFNVDANKIMVGGESAGGNLAGAVTLFARDNKGPKIASQLLINPIISSTINAEVYDNCPDHYFITKEIMRMFWGAYMMSLEVTKNPYASLDCNSDLSGLPPALIITAEYDPLRYDTEKYAEQLKQAGIPTTIKCIPGVIHGFLYLPLYEESQKVEWTKQIAEVLVKPRNTLRLTLE